MLINLIIIKIRFGRRSNSKVARTTTMYHYRSIRIMLNITQSLPLSVRRVISLNNMILTYDSMHFYSYAVLESITYDQSH